MEGSSAKKSTSLETLVIQNISNVNDLKAKLNDIIKAGKDYEYEVSPCIQSLLHSSDQEIVRLAVQAVSELAKSEEKRETYANKDIIVAILKILEKEYTADNHELVKHCCRSLGNLCCDCDASRDIILAENGVKILKNLLDNCQHDIKILICKTFLNFGIGGQKYCAAIVQEDVVASLHKMLTLELLKHDMDDDTVSTALELLGVLNDNVQEIYLSDEINKDVLSVLRETANLELSELCLDHFNAQVEHEAVKTLIAKEGGGELLCIRLQQLLARHEAGQLSAGDTEVESIVKQACDLLIVLLTGDEAMHIMYNKGTGEVYKTAVKWLDSTDYNLLTSAVLAIGNFARQDDYCVQMMQDGIYDKLLDIFENHQNVEAPEQSDTLTRIQHAVLSALRNLAVPVANKRTAAENGRAGTLLLSALPKLTDHHVAYKLLAAIRMLLDGQECIAKQLANDPLALAGVCEWARAGAGAGAGGEAPRLIAWTVKQLKESAERLKLVQVDGCISSLVNMLLASHSLMQNESIIGLTLLAAESFKKRSPVPDYDFEKSFCTQLIKAEIGKHVSVLVDTNCAKMPLEVVENLIIFLELTSNNNEIVLDYKEAMLHDILGRFSESRGDLSIRSKSVISKIRKIISLDEDLKRKVV